MSVPVAMAELDERIAEYGPRAFLVTVTASAAPHVVSVLVAWRGDRLTVGAGRQTAANAAAQAEVTLVWSPLVGGDYSLIVDGTASAATSPDGASELEIVPAAAVLHRVAGAATEGPSCIAVLPR